MKLRYTNSIMFLSQFPIHVSWVTVSLCGFHAYMRFIGVPRGFALSVPTLDSTFRTRCSSIWSMGAHPSNPAACIILA